MPDAELTRTVDDRCWWALWWAGVVLVPLSGIVMLVGARHCTGLWAVDSVTRHRCAGAVPGAVWLIWLAAFACMTVALPHVARARVRTVVLAQLAAGLLFVMTPTLPSADVYGYHVYGAIADPWHPVAFVPQREAIATGLRIWGNPPVPSPYGPLLVDYERVVLTACPSLTADQLVYVERCLALLAAVLVTVLLRGPRIAFWALHPLVLFEFALAAHCDVLMLALIALSLRSRNALLAGIAIGAAGMVKIVALGAAAFRLRAIPTALATVALILLLQPQAATFAAVASFSLGISGSPGFLLTVLSKMLLHVPHPEAFVRNGLFVAAILCVLVLRVGRRNAPAYATLLLLGASMWIVPWYLTWAIFAARYAHRTTALAVSAIGSAALLLEAHNQTGAPKTELLGALAFLAASALALAWAWRRSGVPRLAFVRPG